MGSDLGNGSRGRCWGREGAKRLFEIKGEIIGVVIENVRTVEVETNCGVVFEDGGWR